jgi:hypothetical protein
VYIFCAVSRVRQLSIASEFLSFPSLMFNCPEGHDTYGKYVLDTRIGFHISLKFVFETCFASLNI